MGSSPRGADLRCLGASRQAPGAVGFWLDLEPGWHCAVNGEAVQLAFCGGQEGMGQGAGRRPLTRSR